MLEVRIGSGERDAFARMIGVANDLDIQRIWPDLVQDVIYPAYIAAVRRNFSTQGGEAGESWNYSTEPRYAAWKEEQVGHTDVLRWQKGGTYERLFPSLVNRNHEYHYFRLSRSNVSIGTIVPYAHRLTIGDDSGPFGEPYPGRTFVAMSQSSRKKLVTDIQRYIHNRLDIRGRKFSL